MKKKRKSEVKEMRNISTIKNLPSQGVLNFRLETDVINKRLQQSAMPILQRLTSRHETRKHPKEDVSTTRGGRNHRYNIILHNLSVHLF